MSLKHDLNIVSISALGKLHTEVDIQVLAEDVPFPIARYEPEMGASLFRFEEDGELMILYSSVNTFFVEGMILTKCTM